MIFSIGNTCPYSQNAIFLQDDCFSNEREYRNARNIDVHTVLEFDDVRGRLSQVDSTLLNLPNRHAN